MDDNQSNVGKKWTIDEDNQLLNEVNNAKNYDIIALNHKRTKNAIILRVISHIIYPKFYDNDNDNNDENISKEYDIDIELLRRNINKIKNKNKNKSSIKPKPEIKINYNEKILEQLLLLNKKIDNLILIMK